MTIFWGEILLTDRQNVNSHLIYETNNKRQLFCLILLSNILAAIVSLTNTTITVSQSSVSSNTHYNSTTVYLWSFVSHHSRFLNSTHTESLTLYLKFLSPLVYRLLKCQPSKDRSPRPDAHLFIYTGVFALPTFQYFLSHSTSFYESSYIASFLVVRSSPVKCIIFTSRIISRIFLRFEQFDNATEGG